MLLSVMPVAQLGAIVLTGILSCRSEAAAVLRRYRFTPYSWPVGIVALFSFMMLSLLRDELVRSDWVSDNAFLPDYVVPQAVPATFVQICDEFRGDRRGDGTRTDQCGGLSDRHLPAGIPNPARDTAALTLAWILCTRADADNHARRQYRAVVACSAPSCITCYRSERCHSMANVANVLTGFALLTIWHTPSL